MIRYTLYQKNPCSHYLYVDLEVDGVQGDTLQLQLPSWRPGRYELGNFARNIKRVDAWTADGKPMPYHKLNKDCWEVNCAGQNKIKLTYSYYAAELNAGSCYCDDSQIYVNPVHCCMYIPGRENESHEVFVKMPADWRIAGSMPVYNGIMVASSFDELADSPFIASAQLQTQTYTVQGIPFYLHFNGPCIPAWEQIRKDFVAFTETQVAFWGSFPVKEYHFLFQILPQRFYHGVEHCKSTVIALGPGYEINSGGVYEDLLGVSSHELFHTWNVKLIRPAEMLPYDLTRENYAITGYVYEGFTTYYGDKLLLASKVFSLQQYFATLEERLQKHLHNFGRYNLDVAQSSWDTWLDGYVPGAPYRKTSIYDEGCLVAFMLDVEILRLTQHKCSLRDVCVLLYERFGKKARGYKHEDLVKLTSEVAGQDLRGFFDRFVTQPADYAPALEKALSYLGIELEKQGSPISEYRYGMKPAENGHITKLTLVAPYSPAWHAGLFAGDEIVAVNGMAVRGNVNHWLMHFSAENEIDIAFISSEKLKRTVLKPDPKGNTFFYTPRLARRSSSPEQEAAFQAWISR